MKRYYILLSAVVISIMAIAEVLSDNGKAGYTGSPGEQTCNGCHSGSGGTISITSTNMTNWEYVPGTTYNMSVTVAKSGVNLFGLGVEALNSSNQNAGTLIITNTSETTIKTANGKTNVVHKLNGGAATNTKTFNFNWAAPTTAIGNITFYFAGVSANANGSDNGDFVSTGSQIITSNSTASIGQTDNNDALQVYPNPASNLIHIQNVNLRSTEMKVEIIDYSGKIVFEKNIATSINSVFTINEISNYSNGFYFVKTTTSNNVSINKILVSR